MAIFFSIAQAGVVSDAPRLASVGLNVLDFLLSIFGVIVIIMLVISGTKYFLALGDAKQKEEAKKGVQNSVVGVIVVMGAMVVIRLVGMFFK